jgi:PQQ-like domain
MRIMKTMSVRVAVLAAAAAGLMIPPTVDAQGRGGPPPWATAGADAQRTASVKTDPKLNQDSVSKEFKFLWKRTFENQPKQLDGLTQPVLLPNIISYKGFKALAFVGGSSDAVFAIDDDLSRLFWQRRLETGSPVESTSVACSGALTTITRASPLTSSAAARGRGRGAADQPAAKAAGTPAAVAAGVPPAPGAAVVGGAPDPRLAAAGRGTAPTPPPPSENPPMPGSGPGPNAVLGGYAATRGGNANVYAISSGGLLHALNPQDGTDMVPPIEFLPPGARATGSILLDSVLYAATTGGCGGAPNGVWAIELADNANTVAHWESQGAVAGDGPAFGTDGTVYAATGGDEASGSSDTNAVVALEPKTLKVKGTFSAKTPFTTAPIVFADKGRAFVAAGNQDGRVYVLDAASLASGTPPSPLVSSEPLTSADGTITGLATIDDASGSRWILASVAGPSKGSDSSRPNGAVVALQLADPGTTPALPVVWTSPDLVSPVTPAIVGGVVFALSSGEDRGTGSAAERASRSKPAVLYALDGATGKELWSSGTTITSFVHGVGPAAGDSQVYVVTHDGTLYAFGIPMER